MSLGFGDLELDQSRFELRRGGVRVPLEPQAFDVLVYLLQHRDRVVSKEELMDQIWGGRFVSETAVTSQIKQVRRAVGDDGQTQAVIKTVYGRGYHFVASVSEQTSAGRPEPPASADAVEVAPDKVSIVGQLLEPGRVSAPPLFGRATERSALGEMLDRAQQGAGHTVLIGGEPGIGKSALLADLMAAARSRGARVLIGRAVASGGPYLALADALRDPARGGEIRDHASLRPFRGALGRLLPGWADESPVEPGVDPTLLVSEGLLRILIGLGTPVCVLALEDLHDADPDTLAVLNQLGAALTGLPVLVVGTFRDWPRPESLQRLLVAANTVRMPLARLPDAEIAELAASVRPLPTPVRDQLVRQAEGLPLVAAELADSLTASAVRPGGWAVPPSLAALVDARMASLTDSERRLLAAAAVLGAAPDWDLVPQVARVDAAQAVAGLRHAVQLHLLVADGEDLRWRHGMIRQAVRSTLLPPERQSLSRTAAELLLADGASSGMARAAELLLGGGDADRAADIFVALARQSMASGALRTAAEALERAADTGRRTVPIARAQVDLLSLQGRVLEALSAGAPAVAHARGDEHADLCLQLARAAIDAGRWNAAQDWVARAGRPDDPRSLVVLADAAHGSGSVDQAAEYARTALARARESDRAEVLCEALCVAARISRLHDPSLAQQQFAEAAQLASEFGLHPWRATALLGQGTIRLLEEDSGPLVQAREAALDAGMLGRVAMIDLLLTDHRLVVDGPAGLAQSLPVLAEHHHLLGIPVLGHAIAVLAATRAALAGHRKEMERHLDQLPSVDVPVDNQAQEVGVRALLALVEHDLSNAGSLLDHAMRPLLDHGSAAPFVQFGLWALVAARQGRLDAELAARLAGHPASLRRVNRGALGYADAVVSGRSGDYARAEVQFATAERLLEPAGWWHRFLRQLVLEAALVDGWGDPVPLLRADLAAYEQGGDVALARIGRDLLRRAGAPTRRGRGTAEVPPALRAARLTSREVDVLRLVEVGLGNQAIAERLFLSPRTVETHLTNLLAKTGAANRSELRAWSAALTP